MPRTPGRSRSGSVACGSGPRPTWTRRSCGRRCWRCAASGRRSSVAYAHPGCHRTSNPVDRLLRRLDYHLYCTPASARHDGGRRAGAAGLGVDPQLRPVVPGDGPGVSRGCGARRSGSTGGGITPSGSRTCWSRRHSAAIAGLPEKRDKQDFSDTLLMDEIKRTREAIGARNRVADNLDPTRLMLHISNPHLIRPDTQSFPGMSRTSSSPLCKTPRLAISRSIDKRQVAIA